MLFQSIKGVSDILPGEVWMWQAVEADARGLFGRFGFREIRTPIFEQTELFTRSIGQTTDIVKKEMYNLVDKKGRSLTLRPEGTAPVIRAYIEHKGALPAQVSKLYYTGPMFRYERPQGGRSRQFHQIGTEIIGGNSPCYDAESINVAYLFFKEIGLGDVVIEINSVGCPECRPRYGEALQSHIRKDLDKYCPDCKERFDRNILRVLDCKVPGDIALLAGAPLVTDHICEHCSDHFSKVKDTLDSLGVPYRLNPKLVRGLDYYTRTVFELRHNALGALDAIGAGGRYDNLTAELGGEPKGAVGFAVGMERIILALKARSAIAEKEFNLDLFMVSIGDAAFKENVALLNSLRTAGFGGDMDYEAKSIKAQMRQADAHKARFALIRGDDELKAGIVTAKDLKAGCEEKVNVGSLAEWLKSKGC
ncbi:MAG TPA: histidine--tRNA ligase [bacterium]|nr:histidine--tRNA ligase [bacterium]